MSENEATTTAVEELEPAKSEGGKKSLISRLEEEGDVAADYL